MKTDGEAFVCQFCLQEKQSDFYCGAAKVGGELWAFCSDCYYTSVETVTSAMAKRICLAVKAGCDIEAIKDGNPHSGIWHAACVIAECVGFDETQVLP